jgi:hypothetical protein
VEHQELPLRVPAPEREDRRARIGAPNVTHFSTRLVRVRLGILNLTPDFFSDGSRFLTAEAAPSHGKRMAADGATSSMSVARRLVRGQCRYHNSKQYGRNAAR